MGDAIEHIMVSFSFAEHDFVPVSIETRKEVGETYDTSRASSGDTTCSISSAMNAI
jgi:hypothetical protein